MEAAAPKVSARERQMLDLRAAGQSVAAIAAKLGIEKNSVWVAFKRMRARGVSVPGSEAPIGRPIDGMAAEQELPDIAVPRWVPPEFRAGYRARATQEGEEEAAAWARRRKAGEPEPKPVVANPAVANPAVANPAAKSPITTRGGLVAAIRAEKRGGRPSGWTDERIATLERMWSDGAGPKAIAEALGVSRNSVASQLHRRGLQRNHVVGEPPEARPPRPERRPAAPPAKLAPAPIPVHEPEAPPEGGVGIFDLEVCHCRWPVGGAGAQMRYCGARKANGPYCTRHAATAFNGRVYRPDLDLAGGHAVRRRAGAPA